VLIGYKRLSVGFYDMIYLTAIGLLPGGSSTVHIYTQKNAQNNTKQTIHRKTQKFKKGAGRAPSWRVIRNTI
jgi:hypothetical protein